MSTLVTSIARNTFAMLLDEVKTAASTCDDAWIQTSWYINLFNITNDVSDMEQAMRSLKTKAFVVYDPKVSMLFHSLLELKKYDRVENVFPETHDKRQSPQDAVVEAVEAIKERYLPHSCDLALDIALFNFKETKEHKYLENARNIALSTPTPSAFLKIYAETSDLNDLNGAISKVPSLRIPSEKKYYCYRLCRIFLKLKDYENAKRMFLQIKDRYYEAMSRIEAYKESKDPRDFESAKHALDALDPNQKKIHTFNLMLEKYAVTNDPKDLDSLNDAILNIKYDYDRAHAQIDKYGRTRSDEDLLIALKAIAEIRKDESSQVMDARIHLLQVLANIKDKNQIELGYRV